MSLLDDVSIVVTPNGYKAGELYAVIPVPTEGAEEIVDSSFANDLDDWSKYGVTSATGGVATIGASANSGIWQVILTEGVRYTVTVNVISYDGVGTAEFVNANGSNIYTITETGIQTFIFTHNIANAELIIRGTSNALFSLSSVSVKEYTSADMDVTRATAATRVDENGLVNYAEVLGGEEVTNGDFATDGTPSTNTWTLGWYSNTANVSISGGKITLTNSASESDSRAYTTNGVSSNNILITNQLYKLQYEVIANNGVTSFKYYSSGGVFIDAPIDLGVTHTIYIKNTSNQLFLFQNATTNSNISLDNVSVKEVTRDNVPRIDYTGGGCPHILSEPMRTNLIPYSEDFGQTSWTKQSGVTPTYNTTETLSPDGTYNATKFIGNGSSGVFKSSVIVSGNITRSVYLKSVSGTTTAVFKDPNATGGATPVSLTITNDWQRFELTGDNGTGFQGLWIDDITSDGLYMWGAQLEQGSYATSYIPNFGTVAGVTRVQDIFTRDGIGSLINSPEGVLFVEMAALSNDSTRRTISLSDGTNTNRVVLRYDNANNRVQGFIQVVGQTNGNINDNSYTITNFLKIAYKWKAGNFALWINGTEVDVSADATSFGAGVLTQMQFNEGDGAGFEYFGKVKQLQVYTTALTDAQLTSLTS